MPAFSVAGGAASTGLLADGDFFSLPKNSITPFYLGFVRFLFLCSMQLLILSLLSSMVLLVGVVSMMKGGSKRFVAVESKSFDLVVEGRGEDVLVLTITMNAEKEEGAAPWLLSRCGFIGELAALLQSFAAIVTSPAHVALPSSSPVAFSSLDDTSATPNDRLLSEGRTECLDLLCACKGCAPPALELEMFDAPRFEADVVSHSNDLSKAPLECVFSEGCMLVISSVPSGPLLYVGSSLALVTLPECK
ncbi:hypothetical protein Cgig2_022410 [Carnegiea gigantea]|uniref:Transmembrane protein n=1 Tax=Carnegiea gigantea TaxID=171969 RepID=A0A9Q1QHM6_9CARY|nr:hypothetical protein Cgig2_022410 [Carnegiea gigantea]